MDEIPVLKSRSKAKENEDLDFNIDKMFEAPTWSTTLEEHRKEKTPQSFTLDEIEERDPQKKTAPKLDDPGPIQKQGGTIEDFEQMEDSEDLEENRQDMAQLVILLMDMGVDTVIKYFTPYTINQKESDSDKKRKQLENVCVKIMTKYDYRPNVWTELLTVLSVYSISKVKALEKDKPKEMALAPIRPIKEDPAPAPAPAPGPKKDFKLATGIAELL